MKRIVVISAVMLITGLNGALTSFRTGAQRLMPAMARQAQTAGMQAPMLSRNAAHRLGTPTCRRFSSGSNVGRTTALVRPAQPNAQGSYWSRYAKFVAPGAGLVAAGVAVRSQDEEESSEKFSPLFARTYGTDPDIEIARAYQVAQEAGKIGSKIRLLEKLRYVTEIAEMLAIQLTELKLAGASQDEIKRIKSEWEGANSLKNDLEKQWRLAQNPNFEREQYESILNYSKESLPATLQELKQEEANLRNRGNYLHADLAASLHDATEKAEMLFIEWHELERAGARQYEIDKVRSEWSKAYSIKNDLEKQLRLAQNPNLERERTERSLNYRKKSLPRKLQALEEQEQKLSSDLRRLQD